MRAGYARVSTQGQTLALQLDALTAADCERVFQERARHKSANRPQLKTCLDMLQKGDVLVVWRLDRLGRSIKNVAVVVSDLQEMGVKFVSLKDNIDTSSAAGTMQFAVFAGMAQAERELI